MDLFAICRMGLGGGRSILTALATVGNKGNPLLVVPLHLPANFSYFLFDCTFLELHDTCLDW